MQRSNARSDLNDELPTTHNGDHARALVGSYVAQRRLEATTETLPWAGGFTAAQMHAPTCIGDAAATADNGAVQAGKAKAAWDGSP